MYRPLPALLFLLFALGLLVGPVRPAPTASLTTGDLVGTVKDTRNHAIKNAVVRISGGPELRSVRTNGRGEFTMADLLPGSYDLFAQKPGYVPRHQGNVVITPNASTRLDFKLEWADGATGALEVVITDPKGTRLPDSTVDVTRLGTLVARSTTDESGSIVFPGLAAGTYRIFAGRPGYRDRNGKNVRVRAAQLTEVSLKLKRDASEVGRLTGVVRELSGAVVPNARVKIIAGLSSGETRTNAAGIYQFSKLIPDTSYALQISAPGFADRTVGGITVNALQLTVRDVTLLPNAPTTGSLAGTILGPQGDPVPFATVSITAGPALGQQVLAGADGFYNFTGLEPSPDYSIRAEAPGFSSAGRGFIRVNAGATTTVNLQLASETTPPGTLTGTVRDPDGLSLQNVVVTLLNGPSAGLTTVTDVVGEYRLTGVRPFDAYTVRFTRTDYQPLSQPLVNVRSGLTTVLLVELSPQVVTAGHIAGTVINENGRPVKNARVELYAGPSSPLQTTTNADGNYSFRNLQTGTGYAIRVTKNKFPSVTRTGLNVSNGLTTRADFTLRRVEVVGTLSGRVIDLLGRGIGNALVQILEGPERPAPVRTDASGNFAFEGLPSGTYTVEASANGYFNGRKTGVTVSAGGNRVITIQLLRP